MLQRVLLFLAGAFFGVVAALTVLHVIGASASQWLLVFTAGLLTGSLSCAFGKQFWEFVINFWP